MSKEFVKATPIVSVFTRIRATTNPVELCINNLGSGGRLFRWAINPIAAIRIAGSTTTAAKGNVLELESEKVTAPNVMRVTVIAIDTP